MKKFEAFSSLKTNAEKCEAGWIGKAKNCVTKIILCKWWSMTQSNIKILRVHFSYDKKLADKENFCKPIIDGRALLNVWNQHWLSLAGKIQVFKASIISKPVYIATMQHVHDNAVNALQNLHKEFIWGGKQPKIKHCTLIWEYEEGGLKDVDIEATFSALKFLWIKILKDPTNHHPLQVVACELLSTFGGDKLFHSNLKLSDYCKSILKDIPPFYQAVIRQWVSLSRHLVENVFSTLAQSVWNNCHIKANSKPLYNNVMMNKGIYTIADLVDENGSFKPWGIVSLEFSLEPVKF